MTKEEQQNIIDTLLSIEEKELVALSERVREWAMVNHADKFKSPQDVKCGIHIQYRVEYVDEWFHLNHIYLPRYSKETDSERRDRVDGLQGMFSFPNDESSNQMGDVVVVRCTPCVTYHYNYLLWEEEAQVFECTNTGERRKWNNLEFAILNENGSNMRDYDIIRSDVLCGDDLCWFESWHFSLEDDAPCPVAPVIVDYVDDYRIVLRYRDKLYSMSMELGQPHSCQLETDVEVEPTHSWNGEWYLEDYTFDFEVRMSWQQKLYPTPRSRFQYKLNYVRTSDLPADVKTMQQIDHDAWEESTRWRPDDLD